MSTKQHKQWPWRKKSHRKALQESWELRHRSQAPMAYTLAALRTAGGVEMPSDHSMPTPRQLWQAGLASPLCQHCKPLHTAPRHDLMSGNSLGERVFRRWTKPMSVYRFFPCGRKIKKWERNLGCIIVSWWSTPFTQPCRPSKTLSFYPTRQAGLGQIQNGLQHNPIHREGYF